MEWNTQWRVTPDAEDAKHVFPMAGSFPFATPLWDLNKFTHFVHFLVSDVYLGSLHLSRDDLFDTICPICGEDLTRQHVLQDYRGLQLEQRILYRTVPKEKLNDLRWLVRFGEYPVNEFLSMVQKRFVAVGDMDIRSTEI